MSRRGIEMFAEALSHLQTTKGELIKLGAQKCATKTGKQDIRLGKLLDIAKDAVKHQFMDMTLENITEPKKRVKHRRKKR